MRGLRHQFAGVYSLYCCHEAKIHTGHMVFRFINRSFAFEMRYLFLILFSFFYLLSPAQDTTKIAAPASAPASSLAADDDATILYRREASGGITVHSNGWGLTFKSGKHITGFRKRMLDFEIISMSHPKEYRLTNG